ncbi:hypothetical protein [Leeuwenhoekiella sp. H156]|uniref:hypothetical protein n=1 Tax=Leeuwenhoekiella sp. H156 TaxID=3450128 RepID=UPI003FA4AD25
MKIFLIPFVLLYSGFALSQVGINTTTPVRALHVEGNTMTDEKLYLENPGNSTQIRGSKLIIEKTDKAIVQYDINISKYGPINYAQLIFRNTSRNGVTEYDTKISTLDYAVTIQGYYFREYSTNSTSVITASNSGNGVVEGFQVYAYKNPSTNTWFIKGIVNNGFFLVGTNTNTKIDLYLNLIIYRKGFISKEIPDVSLDLNGNPTGSVAKPPGF